MIESVHVSDSSSSDDEMPPTVYEPLDVGSASRPASPMPAEGQFHINDGNDTVTCQWEECGKVFDHLPSLIDHIHNGGFGANVTGE